MANNVNSDFFQIQSIVLFCSVKNWSADWTYFTIFVIELNLVLWKGKNRLLSGIDSAYGLNFINDKNFLLLILRIQH